MGDISFGEKLKQIRLSKSLTQEDVAKKAGISVSLVSQIEADNRKITQTSFDKILEVLDVDPGSFFSNNIIKEPQTRYGKQIPVISWVHAGHFTECSDRWPAGISGEGEPVNSIKKTSPNTFGLRIVGDSMEPRYMAGDVIIVDPAIQCDNNCPCVIKLNNEVTFKMFFENDTQIKLVSLNEKYPDIIIRKDSKVDFKVIGKVVDMIPKL